MTAVATAVTGRALAGLMGAVSLGMAHGAALIARLRHSVRAIGLTSLTRIIGSWSRGPRPQVRPPARAHPRPEPARLEPARPGTRPPAASVAPFAPARAPGAPSLAVATPSVVGRLSTKDWRAAERAVTALLTDVQGTELDRTHHPRFTTIQLIVPHSRYREFTYGLGRIGSWRLEATGFSLPDAIHMTVRVSD